MALRLRALSAAYCATRVLWRPDATEIGVGPFFAATAADVKITKWSRWRMRG